MPKVSIILPVYNAEPFLPLALASLLCQTHRNIEVIALDDGSQDGSLGILQAAADMDPRVSVLSRPNRGLIATLNEGLQLADSDFVARMDADDVAYPARIGAQLARFAEDNALGLLGTNFDTLFAADRVEPAQGAILTKPGERAVFGRFATPLRHPTVMFRRTRLGAGRLVYDPAYPCAEDFDLFRRLAEETGVAETAEPLLAYRLHSGSVTARQMERMVRTHIAILRENLARHYPDALEAGFEEIGERITPDTTQAAGALIRRLDALEDAQPEAERAAFRTGVATVFYFFYAHICRNGRYDLAHVFVDEARRWAAIRRRERVLLAAARSLPVAQGFQLFEQAQAVRRRLSSVAVAQVVPELSIMTDFSKRIEHAARAHGPRNAA